MKKIALSLALLLQLISFKAMAFEKFELKGKLVSNIQSTESSERNLKTIGILLENGELQEVIIPNSDNINIYRKFSGKEVSIEIAYGEGIGEIPVGMNLVVHLEDTQVSYWKGNSQDFFNFPHEEASAVTKTETFTGKLIRMDDIHNEKTSGFALVTRAGRKVIEMPEDRNILYALNMMKGKIVSIVFNKKKKDLAPVLPPIGIDPIFGDPFRDPFADPFGLGGHHFGSLGSGIFNSMNPLVNPISHNYSTSFTEPLEPAPEVDEEMSDEEKEEIEDRARIASIIKPISVGSIEGVATTKYESYRKLVISPSPEEGVSFTALEDFMNEFTELNLNKSVLRVFFRDGFNEDGRINILESYEIVERENEIIESEMDDDDAMMFIP